MKDIKTEKDIVCLKCAKCCYFIVRGKVHRCKHLRKDNTCKFYDTRLYRTIYKDRSMTVVCLQRTMLKKHIEGCPYNEIIKLD